MSKWEKTETEYWVTERREMFPFYFELCRSKKGMNASAKLELPNYYYDGDELNKEASIEKARAYFDRFIDNTERQERRIKELERRLEDMEKLLIPYLNYEI